MSVIESPAQTEARDIKRKRWRRVMTWVMRLIAIAWFAKGVMWWTDILGFNGAAQFDEKRIAAKAVAIGFATLDLVAAVGLWLLSAWGGVMWLLAVTVELVLTFIAPSIFSISGARVSGLIACIVLFLILTSLSAREEDG
ncbi:MAG: DUF6163 family protein [Beijerinckiaceae bacterium]